MEVGHRPRSQTSVYFQSLSKSHENYCFREKALLREGNIYFTLPQNVLLKCFISEYAP